MPHRSLQRVKKKKKFIRFKRYGVNDRSTKIAITNTTKWKKTGLNTTSTHTQNNTFNNNFFYDKTWWALESIGRKKIRKKKFRMWLFGIQGKKCTKKIRPREFAYTKGLTLFFTRYFSFFLYFFALLFSLCFAIRMQRKVKQSEWTNAM